MIVYESPKVLAIRAIKAVVTDCPVIGQVLAKPPTKFIQVIHAGGTSNDIALEHHLLVLEANAPTEDEAWTLIQLARGAVMDSELFNFVGQNANPYPNPNEDGKPRYACTLDAAVRGTQI